MFDRRDVRAPRVHRKTVFLGQKVLEEGDVLGLLRDVDHALETNVFVQPDRPAQAVLHALTSGCTLAVMARRAGEEGGTCLVVDGKLVFEDLVAPFVDGVGGVAIVLLARIDGAPFAIPDTQTTLIQPFSFLLVAPPDSSALFVAAGILWGAREAKSGVV